jgi:hypothetical protein
MQVHTRHAVASDWSSISISLTLSVLEKLLGKHWTTTWSYLNTCLHHFGFDVRGVQLWALSPSFEIRHSEKLNLTF